MSLGLREILDNNENKEVFVKDNIEDWGIKKK